MTFTTTTGGYTATTRVITYTYDPLNRLTSAAYSTGEQFEYAYDAVGNRTAMTTTAGVTLYTYDAANRLTSINGVPYTWDARGNLINDGTFTYTYNAAGRMVRAESLTTTLVYTYTADGLRVAQSVGDVTMFAWDWASGVPEMLSESGNLYLVGHDTLGRWDGSEWTYHLPDALGSVRQVTDAASMVLDSREWTPFGVEVGTAQAGLGFTGEWGDPNLGMTYLRARWYAPYLNRFISPDTIVPDFRNPQSINRYLYALANPLKYTDPEGLAPQPPLPYGCSTVDRDAYNLTDWLVREMHYQSNHWPVQWGISLLNTIGRHYDPSSGGLVDSVVLSLAENLRTYIPWNWDEHSYRNDIATLAYTGSSLWWAGMVKDGARWDFKDQIKAKFGDSIVLCDIGECRWYEYSMPGNIFFAYVGRVAGFSEWDIRAGAIYAQQTDPENDPALNDWLLGLDQASDQAALELGFMMHNLTYGAADEITLRYAFKTALLIHKDRLAAGRIPTDLYVLTPEFPIGPDGPEFPLRYFDGTNCMGWMGE